MKTILYKFVKSLLVIIFSISINTNTRAGTPIPKSNYTVLNFSSDNTTHPVAHAFDNSDSTWWALYNDAGFSLPAFVEIDLGSAYNVSGFVYTPNAANSLHRAIGYEVYFSHDGVNWGTPETIGNFSWTSDNDVSKQEKSFGAVSTRYVKMVYTSSTNTNFGNIHTGDLYFLSDDESTGQKNQTINFSNISDKFTDAPSFNVNAVASSGLDITYSIVSGPATISYNTITLNGTGGLVEVMAEQAGNADYYNAQVSQTFNVTDVSNFTPILSTRLTENFPIEMPQLHAYPIYINAKMSGPSYLALNNVNIEIDDTSFNLGSSEGDYTFWWTPSGFGVHTINITASGSNGSSASITRDINVTNTVNSQTVTTMQDVVIEFNGTNSRWFNGSYTLPQHVGSYDKIIAKLKVECPSATGNCDDWDRKGYINIKAPDGNWIELIRYMTPYNVGCNHEIDVTDYASLLQGEFDMQMFIDTWGTGGWQITLDFEYQKGTPEYLYSQVDEIWDGTFPLGNPTNLQPVPTINYKYNNNIVNSHLRLMTTGHGWGQNNSQNAAEFYDAINFIDVDGNEIFEQDIEKRCNPNPDNCYGQQGTWYNSRAGWCPGAIARPDIINLTDEIGSNPIALAYRFDPNYIDECHPNNPDCVSGVTCPDCDDNFAAIYLVDAQVINFSNTPILDQTLGLDFVDNTINYNIEVFPNPSKGKFKMNVSNLTSGSIVSIHNISGQTIKNYIFENEEHLNTYPFNMEGYPAGVYFISLESNSGTGHFKLIIK